MVKLVLLRHGESIWNRENKLTGWMDIDLSDSVGVLRSLDCSLCLLTAIICPL